MAVGRSRLAGVIGPILIFLGALLLTAAVATPLYVTGRLKSIPLNVDVTSVATSTVQQDSKANAQFPSRLLDQCSISNGAKRAVVNDVYLTTQTRTLVTDPSDKNSMTFQSGMSTVVNSIQGKGDQVTHPPLSDTGTLIKDCGDGLLQAWVDRVSVDRKTAAPDGQTSETTFQPGTDAPTVKIPDRKGYQYRFPANTAKDGQYSYYDLTTRSSVPMKFVDTKDVSGVDALHFVATGPETDLAATKADGDAAPLGTTLTMTAGWWGIPRVDSGEIVSLDRHAQTTTDLYIDPDTGTLVNQVQHLRQWFAPPAKTAPDTPSAVKNFSLEVLDTQQSWNRDTIESQASAAKSSHNENMLAKRVVPIVGGVLGILALIAGILALLVALRGRRAVSYGVSPSDADAYAPTESAPAGFGAPSSTSSPSGTPSSGLTGTGSLAGSSRVGFGGPPGPDGGDADTEAFTQKRATEPEADESQTEALDTSKIAERRDAGDTGDGEADESRTEVLGTAKSRVKKLFGRGRKDTTDQGEDE
ncbi:DUF3068 domain-containing protein [Tsukamurella sp. 8F]|uniref:DUF3068 domain-containing protein n=1 Tax=unclassified Tsukamurella TaxID=2633480 RepID=UPI0023B9197B|nr:MULTISPECIES: DUF3068 domain-containing protein [unclassified Tsukamurella]MDF0529882.1 DUF3068 domain-containing protein [Tsukamurella sp. 8J]MDF0588663.1 DUF3068 domain-containing protein [Tsukamurella sp. 8F]